MDFDFGAALWSRPPHTKKKQVTTKTRVCQDWDPVKTQDQGMSCTAWHTNSKMWNMQTICSRQIVHPRTKKKQFIHLFYCLSGFGWT